MNWFDWATGWIRWDSAELSLIKQQLNRIEAKIDSANSKLDQLLPPPYTPGNPTSIIITSINVSQFKEGMKMADLAVAMTDAQKVTLGPIAPGPDAAGKPATFKSTPVWTTTDKTVAAITPSADNLSCDVVAGNPGAATVAVSVEGDVKPGVDTLTQNINFAISGGDPTGINVPIGTPVAQ